LRAYRCGSLCAEKCSTHWASEIENKEREGEDIVVDSNWSIQDVTQLVALEVLTVDEARKRLGLGGQADRAQEDAAQKDVERIYARTNQKTGQ